MCCTKHQGMARSSLNQALKFGTQFRSRKSSVFTKYPLRARHWGPRLTNKAGFVMGIDLIGIGAGPANLSLAALLTIARERGLSSLSSIFLERNPAIFWHSQQMFPGTLMQTEFYRDLVTPIDPTSRFSFLNYLKSNARLEQFFCSSTICPTRQEFEDYFNWVATQIADIVFAVNVNSVD